MTITTAANNPGREGRVDQPDPATSSTGNFWSEYLFRVSTKPAIVAEHDAITARSNEAPRCFALARDQVDIRPRHTARFVTIWIT